MDKYRKRYSFPFHLRQPDHRIRWHEKEISQFNNSLLDTLPLVTDWDCAIDGGSYVGTWTWVMAQQFKTVYAFEPTKSSWEELCFNMASFHNVICSNSALGNINGRGLLLRPKGMLVTNTVVPDEAGDVDVVTIDSLNLDNLNLLKLDLNGGDTLALYGARETLIRCHPVIIVEEKALGKDTVGTSANATDKFLRSVDYMHVRTSRPDCIYVHKNHSGN